MVMTTLKERIAERLEYLSDEAGYEVTKADIARKIDVLAQYISNWEGRDSLPKERIRPLAEALRCDPEWLAFGEGKPTAAITGIMAWDDIGDLDKDKVVMVRDLEAHASAGNGTVIYEAPENEKPLAFSHNWIHSNGWKEDDLFTMKIKGDSMQPTISDGSKVLINKGETSVIDGKIYLLRIGSEVVVKRLFSRIDGGYTVRSDNPLYDDKEVPRKHLDLIKIIGRVTWQAGTL